MFVWAASSEFGAYRLCIRAVSPEPPLLAHTSIESRGSLAPLNGWACAVKSCHDGMLEDTNSLDAARMLTDAVYVVLTVVHCISKMLFI